MTREHKLALILGFALVLVVGVLVSDHISGAERGVASTQSMDDPIRAIETELGPGLGQVASRSRDRALPGLPVEDDSVELASGESDFIDDLIGGVRGGIEEIRRQPPPHAGALAPLGPVEPGELEMGRPKVESSREDTKRPDAEVRLHRIEEGETLWSIAQRYYGDGNLHPKLAEWNTDRVGSGGTIRPGASLVIPSRAELDGGEVRDVPRDTRPNDPVRTDPPKPEGGQWVYVVKRGDVLSTIAQRELGTVKRMDEILRLNSDKIKSADEIWVGLELKMPAR
jgi:nucleoid-associated protein YgaU